MSKILISFFLPVQIILLVLFYGNILPMLPLWVVWSPCILVLAIIFLPIIVSGLIVVIGAVVAFVILLFVALLAIILDR